MMIAEVVVDISNDSVDRVYDYFALPTTQVGMRVRVPFANRLVLGYVLKLKDDTDFDKSKLKTIKENLDDLPLIKPELVEMTDFMSSRFFLRKADIFKLILPASIRNDTVKDKTYETFDNFRHPRMHLRHRRAYPCRESRCPYSPRRYAKRR